MNKPTQVIELLFRNGYLPVVRATDTGVSLTLPEETLRDPDSRRYALGLDVERGREGLTLNLTSSEPGEARSLPCPEYAVRLLIQTVLAGKCADFPIDVGLTAYLDREGERAPGLDKIFPGPSDEGREGALLGLFYQALQAGFPPEFEQAASDLGVREGYDACKSYYQKGSDVSDQ